ncbi:MAG: FTR1 family protein [Streptosporangiaceae bacterium]|jgi:high-affinity iron transporter
MLATLVIFLREGVEASMIVAILLAYLNRIGRRDHFRDVFVGVGAALVLAGAGGVIAYETIRTYDGSRAQTIFETATFLVAATVLTYMTFWMRGHARSLSKELRARTDAALNGRARWGLGLLAFQAVGREGLETVVFTLAIIFSTSTAGALTGALIGLAGALCIAFVIYRLGHRLNLARFFTVIGVLLMIFAAGLIADAVENLQQLGWLPLLRTPMWHSGRLLSEASSFGDVLHSFFGYSDAPTPLQLILYVGYLAIVIVAFLGLRTRAGRRAGGGPAAATPAAGAPAAPAASVPGAAAAGVPAAVPPGAVPEETVTPEGSVPPLAGGSAPQAAVSGGAAHEALAPAGPARRGDGAPGA